ncbi:MAG: Omp28-related outer membrane protein [Bacteroidota bacterium]|nr:Omp28-related outer membrane protein [Bacteroidota bacterium]
MKNQIVILSLFLLLLACSETPPPIDYGRNVLDLVDTSYVLKPSNRSAPQEKGVIIEEFSGVKCVNCPAAHQEAKRIVSGQPKGRVFVATMHPLSIANQTSPFEGEEHLSNEFSENIMNNILGKPDGIPAGSVDRYVFDGQTKRITLGFSSWDQFVKERLAISTPVNIVSKYNVDTSSCKITLSNEFEFTQELQEKLFFTVYLLENNIIQKQKNNSETIDNYQHNHVLRKTLTFFSGDELFDSPEQGRFIQKEFVAEYSKGWKDQDFEILVSVHKKRGNDWEVLHVVESTLE